MDTETLQIALQISGRSFRNEEILKTASRCGWYFCCRIFSPSEIESWTDAAPRTAICSHCGVDSILDDGAFTPFCTQGLIVVRQLMFSAAQ